MGPIIMKPNRAKAYFINVMVFLLIVVMCIGYAYVYWYKSSYLYIVQAHNRKHLSAKVYQLEIDNPAS